MASSIYINSNSLYDRYVQFLCEQTAVNPVTNKSTVKWTLATKGANGSSVSVSAITCKVNGVTVAAYGRTPYSTHQFPAYGEQSVSGTIEIEHTSDGTKNVNVSLAANYNDTYAPIEQVKTWTLNPIPRTPYITQVLNFSSSGDPTMRYQNPLGESVTTLQACISLDGSTAFSSWVDLPKTATQAGVTITTQERYDLITATTGTTRTVYYLLKSVISGTTNVSSETATFTVLENALTRPTVSVTPTVDNSHASYDEYGGDKNYPLPSDYDGIYVFGRSELDIAVTAAGKFGATIASVVTTVNGQTYTGTAVHISDSLPEGTVTISTTVTDSRGFTNTATATLTVSHYDPPTVIPYTGEKEVLVYRSDAQGNPDATKTTVWVKYGVSYTAIATNDAWVSMRYREIGTQNWSGWSIYSMTNHQVSRAVTGMFAKNKSYEFELMAADECTFNSSLYQVPTEAVTLDLNYGGAAVGIGRYADSSNPYSVSIGWRAYFDEDIYVKDNDQYVPLPLLDMTTILNAVYPVGCLYWSSDNTNPATVLGIGTWTQITDTFILAAGSTYTPAAQYTAQAGEASHQLAESEMPAHTHGVAGDGRFYSTRGSNTSEISGLTSGGSFSESGETGGVRRTRYTDSTGNGDAHNNMPPYLVRYCWERTA